MDLVLSLLLSAPTWMLLAVGVIYGLLMRAEHSRVSLLASVALGGFLVLDLTGTVVAQLYFRYVLPHGGTPAQALAMRGFFLFQSVVHSVLLALAITAAALDRKVPDDE